MLQSILFKISLKVSQTLRLEYHMGGSLSAQHTYCFFISTGPRMIIVRKGHVHFLGSAFEIEAKFDNDNQLVYCRPMCMNTQPDDLVLYGDDRVSDTYQKYHTA